MKLNHKNILFEKSLRTGLLLVCFLVVVCVTAGCGSEEMEMLLSELQREETFAACEGFDETESGYLAEADAGMEVLQTAMQGGGAEEFQSTGQNTGATGIQGSECSVGSAELQGSAYNVGAEELQGTGRSVGALNAGNQPEIENIYVHVCGEVKRPGVYKLPAGSRFYEAVAAAGGFTKEACQDYLNMAAPLADGSRLEIPSAEEVLEREKAERKGENPGGDDRETEYSYYTPPEREDPAPADTAGETPSDGLVNINTADIEGLCVLPGIGEGRAKAIIEYREKQGGFRKKEDIMQVSGIGEKMYARMEAYLTVE